MERLSSGRRINNAIDDPAGLGIANRLLSQERGTLRGIRNMNDALGFLNVAEGALSTQLTIIGRLRELAMQSANGTLSNNERSYLNTEFQALLDEFDRIRDQTEFNGEKILNGRFETKSVQIGSKRGETIDLRIPNSAQEDIFAASFELEEAIAEGTYSSRQTYGGVGLPSDILSADLNGDGYNDVLVSSLSAARVYIFLNNQSGAFTSAGSATVGNNSGDMDLADVNNDGHLDMVAAKSFGGGSYGYITFLGNGNGTFQAGISQALAGPTNMREVHFIDLNNDGNKDLVYAFETVAYTMLGNGDGSFQSPTTFTGSLTTIRDMEVADVNNDGHDDIILGTNTGGYISVFLGQGGGAFSPLITSASTYSADSIDLGDINGDGNLDLAVGNAANGHLLVHFGNGDGTFNGTATLFTGSNMASVLFSDRDGDGDQDLVALNAGTVDRLFFFDNDGNGVFTLVSSVAVGDNSTDVIAADIDGDGIEDLITTSSSEFTFSTYLQNSQTSIEVGRHECNIGTQDYASYALTQLDNALGELLEDLSTIGAQQSRLEFSVRNSQILVESLAAARSQIVDADMAVEVSEMIRLQILQQATTAVLAQANNSLSLSLKLFEALY